MSEPNVTSAVPVPPNPSSKWRWRWKTVLPVGLLLATLRRWWTICLPAGLLLASIAVAAIYYLFVPQYEASALLEIIERPEYIAFEPNEGVSNGYFRTQIEIIRSRWILGRAVANEKIKQLPEIRNQSDPIEWLRKHVSVVPPNGSNLFEIKYSSPNPEGAALVVNEVTKQYLTAQEEEEAKRSQKIVAALAGEMESREKDVRALRSKCRPRRSRFRARNRKSRGPTRTRPGRTPWGIAKPADRRSGRAHDAQCADQGERRGLGWRQAVRERPARTRRPAQGGPALQGTSCARRRAAKAVADSPEIKQLNLQRAYGARSYQELSKQGEADPLYIKQKEIAIIEKHLDELNRKLAAPIETDTSLEAAAAPSKEEIVAMRWWNARSQKTRTSGG